MSKKRLIFSLLYSEGNFCLSRNFRLQSIGDIEWLEKNYNFAHISREIDELVVIDVSRQAPLSDSFLRTLKRLSKGCFVPITVGGGIRTLDDVGRLLRSGADKVLVNSKLFDQSGLVDQIVEIYGAQCVVGGIDYKSVGKKQFGVFSKSGTVLEFESKEETKNFVMSLKVGEIYFQSIDRDGTGQGLDLDILDWIPKNLPQPIIISGGIGNASHFKEGLLDIRTSAVATANLLNFVGTGLGNARKALISWGIDLPIWS